MLMSMKISWCSKFLGSASFFVKGEQEQTCNFVAGFQGRLIAFVAGLLYVLIPQCQEAWLVTSATDFVVIQHIPAREHLQLSSQLYPGISCWISLAAT